VPEPLLAARRVLLQRAISNLVRNAIDFAPLHSTVEIAARESGRQVALTVRDHGRGCRRSPAAGVREVLLDRAPDSGKKGTGLGLAFVKEVAALHGGTARLANHPDGGAVATCCCRAPRPPRTAAFRPRRRGSSSLHIAFRRASHAVQGACAQFAACAAVVAARTGNESDVDIRCTARRRPSRRDLRHHAVQPELAAAGGYPARARTAGGDTDRRRAGRRQPVRRRR